MSEKLFRTKAMTQLASADQLDQIMEVTTSRGWLALLALGIILVSVLLWGIFGTVPTKVEGAGIVLLKQGVFSVFTETTGKVQSVLVHDGDAVVKGQVLATIYSEPLEEKIEGLTTKLKIFRNGYEVDLRQDQEAFQSFLAGLKNQRATLEQTVRNQKTRLAKLKEKVAGEKELYRDQLITHQALTATEQDILDAENEIQRLGDEINKLTLEGKERENGLSEKVNKAQSDILQMENELDLAKKNVRELVVITSPHDGRVIKVEVEPGTIMNPGDRIAMLEADRNDEARQKEIQDAVVYVNPAEGKRIKPGMEVQVIPSTVKAEEYGVMLGKVVSVSDFPVTPHAMLGVLANSEIVQTFLKQGAPIEVWVDLLPDSKNPSGFRWSSPKGPPIRIYPGTLCATNIVVRRQAPISLVIPLLRKAVFGPEGILDE